MATNNNHGSSGGSSHSASSSSRSNNSSRSEGTMSVNEAGQRGGETTRDKYGHEFYEDIGHKGGQRVKELIEEGKESEGGSSSSRSDRAA
jgi:general stress protein YciG